MVDYGQLFNLPIVRCHHKETFCKFAYHDPHYTFFPDGRTMDLWVTRCFVGREYNDCEDYRSGSWSCCGQCSEGVLPDPWEDTFDEGRGSDLLWDKAGGCKLLDYRSPKRYVPKMPNG